MAQGAVGAILTGMRIILLVAGKAVSRRTLIDSILMTGLTFHLGMCAFELEVRKVMVELCRSPGRGRMAICTVQTETPFVRFVLTMAGQAILRRGLQIRDRARIQMTLRADHISMPPG